MSPELAALRDEALANVSCLDWANGQGWKLTRVGTEFVGPCPKCGGTDRFSINPQKNVWLCRICGVGGDVIFLAQHMQGLFFAEACELITGRSSQQPVDPENARRMAEERDAAERRRVAAENKFREQARKDAHEVWEHALGMPMDMVAAYLGQVRGLAGGAIDFGVSNWHVGMPLRFIGNRPYWHNGKVLLRAPAQIAAIQRADGRFGGIHQTYLDLSRPKGKAELPEIDGKALPTKKVLGVKKGGAIRLVTPSGCRRLVMGEGIETTLTARAHAFEEETAYWAGVDLGNMAGKAARRASGGMQHDQPDMDDLECFIPPDWVEEFICIVDGDEPEKHTVEKITRGMRRAKRLRAEARASNPDLPPLLTFMVPPSGAGTDLNSIAMSDMAEIHGDN
ncbi:hypothetical protein [Devosia sp. DBB001]|nr:hypothetical protein [Devosia sp. DBB001]